MRRDDEMFRMRWLPRATSARTLLHAHLEAYDHLAIATDLPDGSIEVVGPPGLAREIAEVCAGMAGELGLLPVDATN